MSLETRFSVLMNMNNYINASGWQQDVYQNFTLYSLNASIISFIKRKIMQMGGFNYLNIDFKNFYTPFSCLIINTVTHEFFLVRDHFGCEPFYYAIIPGEHKKLCFGSNLPDILAHMKNPVQDRKQISNVLMDICISSLEYTDHTFYKNVFRVTPGHVLNLSFTDKLIKQYHAFWVLEPGSPKIHYASDEAYDAHFSCLLQEAVQVCCQSSPSAVGLEFSGGLDTSAILTALHAEKINAQLFMHIGRVDDERQYGDQLIKHLKSTYPAHYIGADDFDVMAVLDQYKQWFAGGAPYLFFMFAQNIHQAVRQQGCKILLSGFGGDECVSSHAPLRTYGAEVGYKALSKELKANHHHHSTFRQVLQALKLTHPKFFYAIQYVKSYRSRLARKQLPVHYKSYDSLQEREADWLQGNLSHHVRMRVEYSAVVARQMGFLYQYPLLYPPLVEFCFSLPPEQKRRFGQQRLLMRRYLSNKLASGLFDTHKKCGDILPGTIPKCKDLYTSGQFQYALQNLPYAEVCDFIKKKALITDDRLFHIDLLRYMFK